MSYKKQKVKIFSPKEGYDLLASDYSKYHSLLDNWARGLWQRFLPRDLNGKKVLDLGAGDCRLSKYFKDKGLKEYVACDISENMLKKCKSWINKVVCDLNEKWLFENDYFDLILGFFVLLHIENINLFFEEAYRVLKPRGNFILLHHIERRPKIFKKGKLEFKIKTYTWRYEEIEKIAENNFFEVDAYDIIEKGVLIGKVYNLEKR